MVSGAGRRTSACLGEPLPVHRSRLFVGAGRRVALARPILRRFWLQQRSTDCQAPLGALRDARIGCPPTRTKTGLVCDEGRIRSATQLLRSIGTSKLTSRSVPSATMLAWPRPGR